MEISMYVDYYDLVWQSDDLFDEEKIDAFLKKCCDAGVNTIFWRVSVCGAMFYHTKFPVRIDSFNPSYKNEEWRRDIYLKCCEVLKSFDPMAAAVKSSRKYGLKIMPWITLYDDFGPRGNHPGYFTTNYPEYCWKHFSKDEYIPGVVSYVYNETADFRLEQIKELLSYGVDGLLISIGSHSRAPAYYRFLEKWFADNPGDDMETFNKEYPGIWKKFQKEACGKFGFDPPAVKEFSARYGYEPTPDCSEWWAFRRKYFLDFLKKIREEFTSAEQKICMYYRNSKLVHNKMIPEEFFDWEDLAKSELVDSIHYLIPDEADDWNDHFPELGLGENPFAHAVFWMGLNDFEGNKNRAAIVKRALQERHYSGLSFFEAMSFLVHEENWKYIEMLNHGHE